MPIIDTVMGLERWVAGHRDTMSPDLRHKAGWALRTVQTIAGNSPVKLAQLRLNAPATWQRMMDDLTAFADANGGWPTK